MFIVGNNHHFCLLATTLFLIGCASQPTPEPTQKLSAVPHIAIKQLEMDIPQLTLPQSHNTLDGSHFEIDIDKHIDYALIYGFGCGLHLQYEDEGLQLLTNADTIWQYAGFTEQWIPINGKPTKTYIFRAHFKP